jgi:hypothetical protein
MVDTKETPTSDAPVNRDAANWARPVDRLSAAGVAGAKDDAVTGKRVSGPLQGFGQLWQKTFSVRLEGVDTTPEAVVATWKAHFPEFWPKGQRFYAPLSGIAPGEVALLEIQPVPGAPVRLSTGVLVLYADDESFTFMTPEGHTLSAWITFSARRDGDVTVAEVVAVDAVVPETGEALDVFRRRPELRFRRRTILHPVDRAAVRRRDESLAGDRRNRDDLLLGNAAVE